MAICFRTTLSSPLTTAMAASPATHPRFSIYRTEAHYTFALAPARYEDQVPLALEGVVGLLRDFGCAYDFHKHYAEESWAKEWDIWTERPMPASLLQRIRAVEGVLYIFRSHPGRFCIVVSLA